MSRNNLLSDIKLIINGLQKVLSTQLAIGKSTLETKVQNSSFTVKNLPDFPQRVFPKDAKDTIDRASMVPKGVQAFVQHAVVPSILRGSTVLHKQVEKQLPDEEILIIREEDLEGIYIKSLGVELLQDNEVKSQVGGRSKAEYEAAGTDYLYESKFGEKSSVGYDPVATEQWTSKLPDFNFPKPIEELEKVIVDQQNSFKGSLAHVQQLQEVVNDINPLSHLHSALTEGTEMIKLAEAPEIVVTNVLKPLSKVKPESRLGATSKQRKVPANRITRLVSYGGLAAGLGFGALAEVTKRSLGLAKANKAVAAIGSNPFLTDANAERIVDTLCRVRGAALKLGQILSIQDNTMINPQLQKVFERVRHAADFMPTWQMERMMESEFGLEWRTKFQEFDMKPFAAASIGQVHVGTLHDGRPVAVKVQYPGVAQGIESDIDNLMSVLNVWKILPDGIFADNIIEVAKRELRWEVDYIRESECAKRFRLLLEPFPDYYVPEVIDDMTTKLVFTTELIEGIPVDKCENLDQETRNRISYLMLDLYFRELFEFRFMQTDPNWSNFLYNMETKQIGLLDFGASREYSKEFVDKYLMILKGAATSDPNLVLKVSREIGFLTGYESKAMENAHIETVMLLGEAFRMNDNPYDFGTQKITGRLQELVPIMVKERLCPPPEEIYSLHRKLSGVFLLCARLKGKVQCRPIFERIWDTYQFTPIKEHPGTT